MTSPRGRLLGWVLVVILVAVAVLYSKGPGSPWEPPSLGHPLGTDELGRDMLSMTARSIVNSFLGGTVLTILALAVAMTAAFAAVLTGSRLVAAAVVTIGQVVESIPLLLWLLVIIAATPEPVWFVEGIAFILASLPLTSRVVIGEFERLFGQPFIDTARLLGMRRVRLMIRHLIPNARSVLFPLAVQLCGLAIAINGAIGVVGFGNRSRLDLGTLLLRGKEHALTEPQLLVIGLAALVSVYALLWSAVFFRARAATNPPEFI